MKAILQRVKFAKVEVGGETVGEIGRRGARYLILHTLRGLFPRQASELYSRSKT